MFGKHVVLALGLSVLKVLLYFIDPDIILYGYGGVLSLLLFFVSDTSLPFIFLLGGVLCIGSLYLFYRSVHPMGIFIYGLFALFLLTIIRFVLGDFFPCPSDNTDLHGYCHEFILRMDMLIEVVVFLGVAWFAPNRAAR